MAHTIFFALTPFDFPDSSVVSSVELVVDVASLSLGIAPMTVYLLVNRLHVGHLIVDPHSVIFLFSLPAVDVE